MKEFVHTFNTTNMNEAIREFEHLVRSHKYIENKNRRKTKRIKVTAPSGIDVPAILVSSYVRDKHHGH